MEVSTTGTSWKDCCSEDGSRCLYIIIHHHTSSCIIIYIVKYHHTSSYIIIHNHQLWHFYHHRDHMPFLSIWIHPVLNSASGIAFLGRTASDSLGKLHGNAFNSNFRQKCFWDKLRRRCCKLGIFTLNLRLGRLSHISLSSSTILEF